MCISTSAFRKYYRPEPKKPYLHSMKLKSPFGRPTRSSYLRSQLSYGHMDRGKIKNLRRDDSDILDCHTLIEPIHKLLTNSLVKQLSVKPTDLYSYLIGSQMVVKVKQEISKSLDFGKKIKPNYTRVGLHSTNCNKNKVKRKLRTTKPPKSCSNINVNTNDCLIIKSKNALSQSCSISTRLNLTEINELTSELVNLENNISVCLKIQGTPRKTNSLYTKQKSSLSENDIVKVVSPRLPNQYPRTQKSYENIISSGRAYSIPSISTERIKGILDDKLCIYGYQTGKTPRTSDFHELDDIAENRLHTLSYYNDNNQLKVPHKTSIRPKSAGDAHNGMNSIGDIKGLLNIQSIHTSPKPFLLSERQPSRIRSAREYRQKHIEQNFRSCLNSVDNLNLHNNDTPVSDETTTNSVHSARQRADIHLPSVKHLMETYEEIEK
uniref:Doublecortin domain-containing protein n=1 Tax=Schistosoma mansoni TaxID=6183 RepID=A0A3Q0KL15_SCHMA